MLSGCRQEVGRQHVVGTVLNEEDGAVFLWVFGNLFKRAVDVALAYRHGVGAVVLDAQIGERFEEAPSGEEVGKVLLRHLADLADELQRTIIGVAPNRHRVFSELGKEGGVEGGVLLCLVIVEVKLIVHAQLAVNVANEVRHATSILVHHRREGRSRRSDQSVEVAYDVGKEVVRHLGAALEVDEMLVVVSALVACTPVVHFPAADVEGVADAVDGVVRGAIGGGVGIAGIALLALDGEVGVVVVDGEDGFAARQAPGGCSTLT